MNVDIEELKRLAEAATSGPWEYQKDSKDFPVNGYVTVRDCIYSVCVLPYEGIRADYRVTDNGLFIAAANPAAILELIAEMERLREDADDLTIELESSEKALKDSRANDYTAMGYLADCRIAVGDNGNRMFPEFVEYLRQLKQQRDELLAALRDVVGWVPGREKWHTNAPIEAVERARTAIAKAEADKR